jgi:hypothetical protein
VFCNRYLKLDKFRRKKGSLNHEIHPPDQSSREESSVFI